MFCAGARGWWTRQRSIISCYVNHHRAVSVPPAPLPNLFPALLWLNVCDGHVFNICYIYVSPYLHNIGPALPISFSFTESVGKHNKLLISHREVGIGNSSTWRMPNCKSSCLITIWHVRAMLTTTVPPINYCRDRENNTNLSWKQEYDSWELAGGKETKQKMPFGGTICLLHEGDKRC